MADRRSNQSMAKARMICILITAAMLTCIPARSPADDDVGPESGSITVADLQVGKAVAGKKRVGRKQREAGKATHHRHRRRGRHRERRHADQRADGDGRLAVAEDSKNQLQLRGSLEIYWGGVPVVRGRGAINMRLNDATVTELGHAILQRSDQWKATIDQLLSVLRDLPETLRATGDLLDKLANPHTRAGLKQSEQLLRWFNQLPAPAPPASDPVAK